MTRHTRIGRTIRGKSLVDVKSEKYVDQNDVMEDAEHVANTVEMEKRNIIKKIARRKTLMELLEIPRRDTEEHTQLQGSTRAKKRKSRPNSRDEHLEKTKKSIANRGQETDGSEGVNCFLNAVRHIGVPETIRAWDDQQEQGEEHRLRDPVHLLAERNGASDRSRVQGAGVAYSTDHTVSRQEARWWIGHEPE